AFTFPGAAPNNSTTACMTDVDGDDYGATNPAAGATAGSDCNDANAATQACASTHIGYDVDLGTSSNHAPNYLLGSRYTVSSSFTVTALAVIGKVAGPNMKLALYSDSAGTPANLIVQTATTALAVGAQEVAVTPTTIPAGDYWFMGIYQSTASIGISYAYSDTVKYRSLSFGTALPASFGAPATYSGQRFNYYIVGY
ncbi:MAG TPA: hypothetical protein PLA94_25005, partial [Myxococcota bacterium]|nr:hypothetical protein [Myxococcota bacterium]